MATLPDNAITVAQYAQRYGLSIAGARSRLDALVRNGKLARQHITVQGRGGRWTVTSVYLFPREGQ